MHIVSKEKKRVFMIKKLTQSIIERAGYTLEKKGKGYINLPDIQEIEFLNLLEMCRPYTMTSPERIYALYNSVKYILDNNIAGDFVECGVWRGGSSMIVAKMLQNRGINNRRLYLYDTFEGMSEPTEKDVDFRGKNADDLLKQGIEDKENSVWCLADIKDVETNIKLTGFPLELVNLIKGKVEDTIPQTIPEGEIALLRLDTDWYDSTRHELIHLYPKLIRNGVLIIDDYGHWEGCRKAVDEYIKDNKVNILLNRIDYTGRIGIKVS